jgi:hypothetical protein
MGKVAAPIINIQRMVSLDAMGPPTADTEATLTSVRMSLTNQVRSELTPNSP